MNTQNTTDNRPYKASLIEMGLSENAIGNYTVGKILDIRARVEGCTHLPLCKETKQILQEVIDNILNKMHLIGIERERDLLEGVKSEDYKEYHTARDSFYAELFWAYNRAVEIRDDIAQEMNTIKLGMNMTKLGGGK